MSHRLPLFPLPNVVLFPGMLLPVHIFEPRYHRLVTDVMAGDGRFGIQLCKTYHPETLMGDPFDVGTVAEILECQVLDDGRLNLLTLGRDRFRVGIYDPDSQPYLMGTVDWLQDNQDGLLEPALVTETGALFCEALRLTHKLLKKSFQPLKLPEEAEALSYFIAENLRGSLILKQGLLEMTSTHERLDYEHETLAKMVKTLAVRTQIEDAFDPCDPPAAG